jgi:rare lipoprotein A
MKRSASSLFAGLTCLLLLAACGPRPAYPPYPARGRVYDRTGTAVPASQRPYVINGRTYYPLPSAEGYIETGIASWYGRDFHGRTTACGERYDMYGRTAAHKTLPLQTMLLVTNLENDREIVVRVNDRGPFVKGRILDLSLTAARELGIVQKGTARVRISALGEAVAARVGDRPVERFLPHQDFNTGDFYVQIGSFTNPANADRLKAKMIDHGQRTVIRSYDDGETIYYRVHVQAGNTLAAAKDLEQALAASGYPGFVVAR